MTGARVMIEGEQDEIGVATLVRAGMSKYLFGPLVREEHYYPNYLMVTTDDHKPDANIVAIIGEPLASEERKEDVHRLLTRADAESKSSIKSLVKLVEHMRNQGTDPAIVTGIEEKVLELKGRLDSEAAAAKQRDLSELKLGFRLKEYHVNSGAILAHMRSHDPAAIAEYNQQRKPVIPESRETFAGKQEDESATNASTVVYTKRRYRLEDLVSAGLASKNQDFCGDDVFVRFEKLGRIGVGTFEVPDFRTVAPHTWWQTWVLLNRDLHATISSSDYSKITQDWRRKCGKLLATVSHFIWDTDYQGLMYSLLRGEPKAELASALNVTSEVLEEMPGSQQMRMGYIVRQTDIGTDLFSEIDTTDQAAKKEMERKEKQEDE
jgi:hypothetical protein